MLNKYREKQKLEHYNNILNSFPNLPPYTLQAFQYPLLSALYEQFKDNKFLFTLQQQSWLATFYQEYYGK